MNVSPKDLVWYNEGGDIQSGGYSVDSLFKTLGISPIISDNLNVMTGGGKEGKNVERFSELFNSTAVPAGLSLLGGSNDLKGSSSETNLGSGSGSVSGFDVQYGGEGMISESLFDKLTKLISPDNNDNNNEENREKKTHTKKAHRQTKKKGNKNNKISKLSNTTSKNRKTKRKNK